MRRRYIYCKDTTQSLLIYTEQQQRLCACAATNIQHSHSHCKSTTQLLRTYTSVQRRFFFFFSSLSACSLWLWHCLDAVHMLNYMYLDQSRCFISSHWSITSIVYTNKCFQSNSFFFSCSRFLASSCSFHFTLSFLIIIFLSQFKYFSSTLALRFFQSWW